MQENQHKNDSVKKIISDHQKKLEEIESQLDEAKKFSHLQTDVTEIIFKEIERIKVTINKLNDHIIGLKDPSISNSNPNPINIYI